MQTPHVVHIASYRRPFAAPRSKHQLPDGIVAKMGVGAFAEPLIMVGLLAGGCILNQDRSKTMSERPWHLLTSLEDGESGTGRRNSSQSSSSATLLDSTEEEGQYAPYRARTVRFWKWEKTVITPNTRVFEDRVLSRLLRRFPFLVETWYWALIYWVCMQHRSCGPPVRACFSM